MAQPPHIPVDYDALAVLCRKYAVKRLAFFGSILRDDFRPDSDVDVLYEFKPDAVIGWDIIEFEKELSALLGGRRVDLVPYKYISPYLRERVLADAQVQYAA